MMAYASQTRVGVDQTKTEIERTLARYGATSFAYFSEPERAIVVFEAHDRRLRFDLPLPSGNGDREAKARRQKWRALLLREWASSMWMRIGASQSQFARNVQGAWR
jgi:hypothetical protein